MIVGFLGVIGSVLYGAVRFLTRTLEYLKKFEL